MLIYNPEKGYLSCNDKTNIVGIGQNTSCNIHVTWPDGKQQLLNDVKANQLLILNYADAKDTTVTVLKNKTLFADITTQTKWITATPKTNILILSWSRCCRINFRKWVHV